VACRYLFVFELLDSVDFGIESGDVSPQFGTVGEAQVPVRAGGDQSEITFVRVCESDGCGGGGKQVAGWPRSLAGRIGNDGIAGDV
jgi:hypothetical protein